ncbi:S-adenosylmethionine decarboxylase [Candidatus Woesearchaeota archaeon]|nr:S-adenosylmethionine decarboxylase [Candidatus Woesearchaeota archaeon]
MASNNWWWGRTTSLDLHGCNEKLLKDPKAIKRFIKQLAKVISMKRHGPAMVEPFGSGKLKGWSAMQFIETSSIVVHCDDKGGRAFIDIFSCKRYNPKIVADFSRKFFGAKNFSLYVEERI